MELSQYCHTIVTGILILSVYLCMSEKLSSFVATLIHTIMYKSFGKYKDSNNISLSKTVKDLINKGLSFDDIVKLYPNIPIENLNKVYNLYAK